MFLIQSETLSSKSKSIESGILLEFVFGYRVSSVFVCKITVESTKDTRFLAGSNKVLYGSATRMGARKSKWRLLFSKAFDTVSFLPFFVFGFLSEEWKLEF